MGHRVDADASAASPVDEALAAVEQAQADPTAARARAVAALRWASEDGNHRAIAIAERALGMVARDQHDLPTAGYHLRRAVRLARRHNLPVEEGEARMSLAVVLAYEGDTDEALAECDRAAPLLHGVQRARLEVQRAGLLDYAGRADEALEAYARALPMIRRAGDRAWEARLRNNRGIQFAMAGQLTGARTDLLAADRLFDSLGQHRSVGEVRQNLGFVEARLGDVPAALDWFAKADEILDRLGVVDPLGMRDRCEVLLPARLTAEARAAAAAAVSELERTGMHVYLPDARLVLAEAALLEGDLDTARAQASDAQRAFRSRGAPSRAAHAALVLAQADWWAGRRDADLLARIRRAAAELPPASAPSLDARLLAGRVALALGRNRVAAANLRAAAASRSRGAAVERSRAWYAEALLRVARGDRRGAVTAVGAGLRVVERHRDALGATDLRARASAHASDLAALGLDLAIERGSAPTILRWAERGRAGSLHAPPIRPPQDPRLAALLAELRSVASTVDAAHLDGRNTAPLRHRQDELEVAVRERARLTGGRGGGRFRSPPRAAMSPRALGERLGDRALVELVEANGTLLAITVVQGRARFTPLGPAVVVLSELNATRFAMRRLALKRGSPASRDAARAAADAGAGALDRVLFGPVFRLVGDRPLVVVPTATLHAVPWALLPSCRGRPVAVSPSASLWLRSTASAGSSPAADGVVLVGGPSLPGASAEIAALGRRYKHAIRLTGRAATGEAVAAALDGASLAHVAAHGRFRSDNPLFSALVLADGPLTVYDLEALRRPPRTLVLSSCESGLSTVHAGDELMGFTASLFASGTATIVASVVPVPDAETRPLMLTFHRALAAGRPPAVALADAQAGASDETAAAGSFVCFGAG